MRDRFFGPTVLLGLAGGVLAAVSGSRDWVLIGAGDRDDPVAQTFWDNSPGLAQVPLAGALGLVVLACWGVLLVSRGHWRRLVAMVSLLASIGIWLSWISGLIELQDRVAEQMTQEGVEFSSLVWTSSFWAAALAGPLCVATGLVAVLRAPHWPAMGSRYDAPNSHRSTTTVPLHERDPIEVWKAFDEGEDPTQDPAHDRA